MFLYPRMKEIRKQNLRTQEDAAILLGITRPQYQLYESGKRQLPLHLAIKFAQCMKCSLDYLVELSDENITPSSLIDAEENSFINEWGATVKNVTREQWEQIIYGRPFSEIPPAMQNLLINYAKAEEEKNIKRLEKRIADEENEKKED